MFTTITKYLKDIGKNQHNRVTKNDYLYFFEAASMDYYSWYLQADPELVILESEQQRSFD